MNDGTTIDLRGYGRRRFWSIWLVSGSILLQVACAPDGEMTSQTNSLSCSLRVSEMTSSSMTVELDLVNHYEIPIRISRSQLPSDERMTQFFHVRRDGISLVFHGPMAIYLPDKDEDFLTINPSESVSGRRTITRDFDFAQAGSYEIRSAPKHVSYSVAADPRFESIECGPLNVEISKPIPSSFGETALGLSTTENCSASNTATILYAEKIARTIIREAVRETTRATGDPSKTTPLYHKWLGAYSASRASTTLDVINSVSDALWGEISGGADYSCETSCNMGVVAYVVSPIIEVIHVCPSFFSFQVSGTLSQADIIIHELSHWKGGTDDEISSASTSQALALAISDPDSAVNDAYNYQFYCSDVLKEYLVSTIRPW